MIDELDFAFDDSQDGHRARHRRGGPRDPRKRKRGRGRSIAALLMTVTLLAVLAAGGWWGFHKVQDYFGTKDYAGSGSGQVTVQVENGDTATDIANKLVTAGVVRSGKAFVDAANANAQSKQIEPGFYQLHQHMKASLALDMLLARDADGALANKISKKVTIPEGLIASQVYQKLSEGTGIPVADFQQAAKDPIKLGVPDWWFKRDDGKKVDKTNIEGFLYPATYEFDPDADAASVLSAMVNQFNTVVGDLDFANAAQQKYSISPYEALVAASLAQAEAMFPEDMPGVVRVLYNRAYKDFDCNCLQLDSTVNYWLRVTGKEAQDSGNLTVSQLHDKNNPYNTYEIKGLPPGPIDSPGKDALSAAINAPSSNNYYFLAIDKDGHTAFAATYGDFCNKVKQAKNNGVSIGLCP